MKIPSIVSVSHRKFNLSFMSSLSCLRTGELHLALHGGMFAGKNQSALLRFQCNHTVEEVRTLVNPCVLFSESYDAQPSSLAFSSAYDGLHVFIWASKHACATRVGDDPKEVSAQRM